MISGDDAAEGDIAWDILAKVRKNFAENAKSSEMTEEFISRISEIGLAPESITDGSFYLKLVHRQEGELYEAIEQGKFREYKATPEPEMVLEESYLEDAYHAARN